MIRIKNTKLRYRSYMIKAAFILLIFTLTLAAVSCKQETAASKIEYLPPLNLSITGFTGSGEGVTINLVWDEPDTNSKVIQYIVYKIDVGAAQKVEPGNEEEINQDWLYKNAEEIYQTAHKNCKHLIGNRDYCFFVTAIYEGDIHSEPSNIACSGSDIDIPSGGSGMGENNGDGSIAEEVKDSDQKDFGLDTILSGPCGNPYYPIVKGASYAYQVTGTRSWIQTHTILDVNEKGFTEEVVQDIVTNTYEWECMSEGLINTYSGIMTTENDTVNTTSAGEGITIPASILIGDTWKQTCQLISSDGKGQGELQRSLTYNRTAITIETVTVPAGTFEAIRVDYDLEADASMETSDGHSLPLGIDYSSGSEWYVENIGLIKKTAGVKLDSMDTPDGPSVPISIDTEGVYELIEYNLPGS